MTNYHPGDICEWVYRYISEKKVFPMVPWFIHYSGKVTLEIGKPKKAVKKETVKKEVPEVKKKVEKDDDEEEDKQEESDEEREDETDNEEENDITDEESEEEEVEEKKDAKVLRGLIQKTEGIYKVTKEQKKTIVVEEEDPDNYGKMRKVKKEITLTDFVITEVPIGVEPAKLAIKLNKLSEGVFPNQKNAYEPYITVKGYRGSMEPDQIGMVARKTLSNITLVSPEGIPISYDNIYQVLVDYCDNIKGLFKLRKKTLISDLKEKKELITSRAFLIKKVYDKEWKFTGRPRAEIKKELVEFKISYDVFKAIGADSWTKEGYEDAMEKKGEIEAELERVKNGDYLEVWKTQLRLFMDAQSKRKEYIKKDIHDYDKVLCTLEQLTSGKIVAPYEPAVFERKKKVIKKEEVEVEEEPVAKKPKKKVTKEEISSESEEEVPKKKSKKKVAVDDSDEEPVKRKTKK